MKANPPAVIVPDPPPLSKPFSEVQLIVSVDKFFGERMPQVARLAELFAGAILPRLGFGRQAEKCMALALWKSGLRAKVRLKTRPGKVTVQVLPTGKGARL